MLDYFLNTKLFTDVKPLTNKHLPVCIGSTYSNRLLRTGRSVKTLLKGKIDRKNQQTLCSIILASNTSRALC